MSSPSSDSSIIIWCHSCRRISRYSSRPHLSCPSCTSEFVEEIGDPGFLLITGLPSVDSDHHNYWDFRSRLSRARRLFSGLFRSYGGISFLRRNHRSQASSPLDQELGFIETDATQNLSRPLLGRGRSRSDRGSPQTEIGNDILAQRIFDVLMQRLANGLIISERTGSRPASKAAVAAMPTITVSKENLSICADVDGDGDSEDVLEECAICKEVFEIGGEVKEMPCKHIYHPGCILPWLEFHSSCPLCRSEMPVDEENTTPSSSSNDTPTASPGADRAIIVIGISSSGAHLFSFIVLGLGSRNDFNHLEREQVYVVDHQVTDDESVNNSSSVVGGTESTTSSSDDSGEQGSSTSEHLVAESSSHGDNLPHETEKVALGENSSHNEHINIRRDVLNDSGIFPGMLDASNLSASPSSTEIAPQNSHRMHSSGNIDGNRSRSFFSWIYRHATSSRRTTSNSFQDHFSSNGEGNPSDSSTRRENPSPSS